MTTTSDQSPAPDRTTAEVTALDDGWSGSDGDLPDLQDRALDVYTDLGRVAELVKENTHLRARLDTMPTIEQSKGILMVHDQIDAETAFRVLCRWSSHNNIKLRHISRLIVDAANRDARSHLTGAPPTIGPSLEDVIAWLDDGTHPRAMP